MNINSHVTLAYQSAKNMHEKALCLYSNFQVGAALKTIDHQVVGGCNIESASYSLTMCAERVALFSALSLGHKIFTDLILVTNTGSYPCGACRQLLYEYCPDLQIFIATPQNIITMCTIKSLIPHTFGHADLKPLKKE